MSHSQFTNAQLGDTEAAARNGTRILTVRGPLRGVNDQKVYTPPFAIHFTIIQSPEGDFDPAHAKRASGITTMNADGEWVATVEVNTADFKLDEPARGVGVAILPRTQGYTSEVLTWCDHLPDLNGTTKEEAFARAQEAQAAA